MKVLFIAGTVALQAQNQAQELIIAHLRSALEAEARQQAANTITTSANNLDSLVKSSFDKDRAQRKQIAEILAREMPLAGIEICGALFDCLLSLIYRAGLDTWPHGIEIHSQMTSAEFRQKLFLINKAADEAASTQHNRQIAPQPVTIELDVTKHAEFQKRGKLFFTMPITASELEGWYSTRISNMSARFYANEQQLSNVAYMVKVGPSFLDKDRNGRPLHFMIETYGLSKIDGKGR